MNRKGFTLIELLVVVAVLALLASIVFSNLGGAREGARISNALSFQSQTHSLLGSDLVGWWRLDNTLQDISGYENHGTNNGGIYINEAPGTLEYSLEFDDLNNDSHALLGNSADFWGLSPQGMSFSVFANFQEEGRAGSIFFAGGSYGRPFSFSYNTDTGLLNIRIRNWNENDERVNYNLSSTVNLDLENWYLLSFTYNFNTGKGVLYLDGEDVDTRLNMDMVKPENLNVFIGKEGTYTADARHRLSDVRIYSRALTASEIQTLYAQTKDNYLAENE